MDANSTYILKIATTKTINAFVSYSSVMTLRLCRDMTNQDGGIREELWNRSNRLLTDHSGVLNLLKMNGPISLHPMSLLFINTHFHI